ncbi:tail assembly protein [Pyramidobacter piscolens]|uniref:hypothetical protein n=1 Tax=Pyramidobacter piscolens TaxID=638849 RepID=UPI002AB11F0B|nr:hypothetical protein [Pyramidobacter piscolens]
MMREVILHGALGAEFGEQFRVDVETVQEAVHALTCQIKGLYRAILRGEFQVIADETTYFDELEVILSLGDVEKIHIVPVPAGSKRAGVLKVILGIALIGVGFAVGLGKIVGGGLLAGMSGKTFLMLGAGFFLNGVGQLMSPSPTLESNEKPNDRPSYLFSSPVNIGEEGNCLPVAYGAPYCSTLTVSSGYDTQGVELSLDNVTGLTATAGIGQITASWQAVSGAADYLVKLTGPYSGSWTATRTSTMKRGLPAGTYTVSVTARNGSLTSKTPATATVAVTQGGSSGGGSGGHEPGGQEGSGGE